MDTEPIGIPDCPHHISCSKEQEHRAIQRILVGQILAGCQMYAVW